MSDKYIIRNCPATYLNFESKYVCTTQIKQKGFPFYCVDCTDCVLKQIVELCKHIKSINKTNSYVGEYIEFTQRSPLAEEILDLLDIQ